MPKLSMPRQMTIVYRRLPKDIREFPGLLRQSTVSKLVIESPISVNRPIRVGGEIIADCGYLSIWFIYRDRWYDVGKFYDAAGRWLGYYCDILKPVKKLLATSSRTVTLTDLFLDLWIARDGRSSSFSMKKSWIAPWKNTPYPPLSLRRPENRYVGSLE